MPRSKNNHKNMSEGWKKINSYRHVDLDTKIKEAHELLKVTLSNHDNPVVCWSGGKDSTVVLHLVLAHLPNIVVIHNDTGVNFPETTDYVKKISDLWDLNLVVTKPQKGEYYWDIVEKYGWPIFSKSMAANVGRARRTGNIRPKLSPMEKVLAENNIKISSRCCDFLHEKPTKKAEWELQSDLKIIGLRALESRSRARLWVDYGDYYYVKRYFGRGRGIWKLNPIALWSEENVWSYHKMYSIPHCTLYDMGYKRNGCWPCAMAIRSGQLHKLQVNHPNLYEYLINKSKMGEEIKKAYNVLSECGTTYSSQLKYLKVIEESAEMASRARGSR